MSYAKNSLTTHILVNNENLESVEETLRQLDSPMIVGDLSGQCELLCKKHNALYVPLQPKPLNELRNHLISLSKTDWQFYLNPGDIISAGEIDFGEENAYNVHCIQNTLITKETRLWKKSSGFKFIKPICESLNQSASKTIPCYLQVNDNTISLKRLQEWHKSDPLAVDVQYYLACTYLTMKKYDRFIIHANNYLFRQTSDDIPVILTKYYLALVYLLVKNNYSESLKFIIQCLAAKPTMAEFWCALGDIFVKLNQYSRAVVFYENAILFGSQRTNDLFPIEILKYKEYPENMIQKIKS
jgi:tetratricopeptide (TPR) repeat protein